MAQEEKYRRRSIAVFGDHQKVDIFITTPLDYEALKADWVVIRNEVANIQSLVDDEFERWNHYLFYLVEDEALRDINLKYKIEHDTISSRKILISRKEYAVDGFDAVVKKYIQYAFEPRYFEELDRFERSREVVELLSNR
jgi:hypothetical protein